MAERGVAKDLKQLTTNLDTVHTKTSLQFQKKCNEIEDEIDIVEYDIRVARRRLRQRHQELAKVSVEEPDEYDESVVQLEDDIALLEIKNKKLHRELALEQRVLKHATAKSIATSNAGSVSISVSVRRSKTAATDDMLAPPLLPSTFQLRQDITVVDAHTAPPCATDDMLASPHLSCASQLRHDNSAVDAPRHA
jgi:hypothetical protein